MTITIAQKGTALGFGSITCQVIGSDADGYFGSGNTVNKVDILILKFMLLSILYVRLAF